MLSWFKRTKVDVVETDPREALLNEGLDLAMQWGKDWLKPIQERLGALHHELSKRELDEINSICQGAMKFGHNYVYNTLKSRKDIKQSDLEVAMKQRLSWVNAKNLSHLFSQGMYYAMKDGLR